MKSIATRPAAGLVLAVSLAFATAASGTELKVLVPPEGALFTRTPATLIGGGSSGTLEVSLNGNKVSGIKQDQRHARLGPGIPKAAALDAAGVV